MSRESFVCLSTYLLILPKIRKSCLFIDFHSLLRVVSGLLQVLPSIQKVEESCLKKMTYEGKRNNPICKIRGKEFCIKLLWKVPNILTSIQWICSSALFIKRIIIYHNIHPVNHHTRKSNIYFNINVYFTTLQIVLWISKIIPWF